MWYNIYVIKGSDQRKERKWVMVVMNKCEYTKMELIKMLEAKLGEGEMVVVGGGKDLTDKMKKKLHSLTDCKCNGCPCEDDCEYLYTEEEYENACDEAYESGKADGYAECEKTLSEAYDEGYADGESHKEAEIAEATEEAYDEGYAEAMHRVREALADLMD